ncbi:histidine kinase [Aliivibrio sp. 1S165]|uniref:HDOD domain-containing protein n=1 Tax=unclassified Aliivibrio TaxID=2645654 RepID=UPI00080EA52B|nr:MULTISPECIES: HDOD domain-containing protein [unclassified Aliivibrio]OCH18032.1 histidine kinase [Aliivibrio sp. 1S165]OCH35409.1 histidine kinase [Aliivibrio sp. 1S175]
MNHLSFFWLSHDKDKVLAALRTEFSQLTSKSISSGKIQLPPIPDVVLKIQKLCTLEGTIIKDISDTLLEDPSLTAIVIRMANSVVFNRRNITCTDVLTAVSRLGIFRVRDIVTAQAIEQLKHSSNLNKECNTLLRKSAAKSREFAAVMTMICEELIVECQDNSLDYLEPEKALLTGLLADIGLFCLIKEYYDYLEKGNYLDLELATYIFNHECNATSYHVLNQWQFDVDFLAVAKNEHTYRNTDNPIDYLNIARIASHLLMFRNKDDAIDEHDIEITLEGAGALYTLTNLSNSQFNNRIKGTLRSSGL